MQTSILINSQFKLYNLKKKPNCIIFLFFVFLLYVVLQKYTSHAKLLQFIAALSPIADLLFLQMASSFTNKPRVCGRKNDF